MVTLGNTQNFSEFELHARAILEIPIHEITLEKNGASAVILATDENTNFPIFSGLDQAAILPNTDFKLFGKPSTRLHRRMGVALAFGKEDVKDLVEKAKVVASLISVN
jgi:phosphoribosylglycinamide formyltransferase 2